MMASEAKKIPISKQGWLTLLTETYKSLVLLLGALLPLAGMSYLFFFVDPNLKFHSAIFHEIAITCATLILAFITFVAYQSYKKGSHPFLWFLTLAFLGFVLIYAPHGILTRMADQNLILFLVFGPASRFILSVYLFIALLRSKRPPEATSLRTKPLPWWPHLLLFIILDVILFLLATSSLGLTASHLRIIESITLLVFVLSILLMLLLRIRTPLLWFYLLALLLFAQASLAFLLARPWNHMWWLAHAIFAAGSFVLGYAIIRAYETTYSFE